MNKILPYADFENHRSTSVLPDVDNFSISTMIERELFIKAVSRVKELLVAANPDDFLTITNFLDLFTAVGKELGNGDIYLPEEIEYALFRYFKSIIARQLELRNNLQIEHFGFDYTEVPLSRYSLADLSRLTESFPPEIEGYDTLEILLLVLNTQADILSERLIKDLTQDPEAYTLENVRFKVAEGACADLSIRLMRAIELEFPKINTSHIRFEGIQYDYVMRAQHSIFGIVFPFTDQSEKVIIFDPTIAQLGLTRSATDYEGNMIDTFRQQNADIEITLCNYLDYANYIKMRYSLPPRIGLASHINNPYSRARIKGKVKIRPASSD